MITQGSPEPVLAEQMPVTLPRATSTRSDRHHSIARACAFQSAKVPFTADPALITSFTMAMPFPTQTALEALPESGNRAEKSPVQHWAERNVSESGKRPRQVATQPSTPRKRLRQAVHISHRAPNPWSDRSRNVRLAASRSRAPRPADEDRAIPDRAIRIPMMT